MCWADESANRNRIQRVKHENRSAVEFEINVFEVKNYQTLLHDRKQE